MIQTKPLEFRPNSIVGLKETDAKRVVEMNNFAWIVVERDGAVSYTHLDVYKRQVLLTALSRIGRNSKVVMTHDVAQRDNLRVGKYDGVSSVVNKLSGSPLFGHIALRKSERSEIAELVSNVLDN